MEQEKGPKYVSVPQEEEQCPESPSPPPTYDDSQVRSTPPTLPSVRHRILVVLAGAFFLLGFVKFMHLHPPCRLPGQFRPPQAPRPPVSPFAPSAPAPPLDPEMPSLPAEVEPPLPPIGLPHILYEEPAIKNGKVPLEAHIMSKCPDAKDCLKKLVVPAMEQISDKVDFRLSYIGKLADDDRGVECMHGPEECLGNIIELCAADEYPDPKIHLGFTMCMTNELREIPQKELVKECALEHGLDFEKLSECVSKDDGEYGMDLLRASVARTADADVTKSCTVRLDGYVRCIRDGGEWKNCTGGHDVDDLVSDVEDLSRIFKALADQDSD